MSFLKDNLLAKNASFISSADALLTSSISQERYRATRAMEALDRVRAGIKGGTSLLDLFGNIGQLSNIIGATLGVGSKAIGPVSELPMEQQIKVNEWRFTKTKSEISEDAKAALRRTPDPGGFSFSDAISLLLGQSSQTREQLQNKFGPTRAGMRPYSLSEGADAISKYVGKVFPFKILNTARVGSGLAAGASGPLRAGEKRNQRDTSFEIFPAYIRSLNEQFNVNWSSKSFFGRSEDVYIYNSASRSFNLDITLFATNDDLPLQQLTPQALQALPGPERGYPIPIADLVSSPGLLLAGGDNPALMNNAISKTDLWRKISFLESLCYPQYDGEGRYARSPFARIDLGSLYENQLMIVQSLNIAYDPLVWDINGEHYTPMFANITIAGVLIHDESPGIQPDGQFGYIGADGDLKFLHRSDFQ